jgi:hypothetical protein
MQDVDDDEENVPTMISFPNQRLGEHREALSMRNSILSLNPISIVIALPP